MKEALKLALEALMDNEHYVAENERHAYVVLYNEVIEKCKAALAQPAPLPYMHSQWQEMIAGIPVTFESEADAKRFLTTLKAKLKELNT